MPKALNINIAIGLACLDATCYLYHLSIDTPFIPSAVNQVSHPFDYLAIHANPIIHPAIQISSYSVSQSSKEEEEGIHHIIQRSELEPKHQYNVLRCSSPARRANTGQTVREFLQIPNFISFSVRMVCYRLILPECASTQSPSIPQFYDAAKHRFCIICTRQSPHVWFYSVLNCAWRSPIFCLRVAVMSLISLILP